MKTVRIYEVCRDGEICYQRSAHGVSVQFHTARQVVVDVYYDHEGELRAVCHSVAPARCVLLHASQTTRIRDETQAVFALGQECIKVKARPELWDVLFSLPLRDDWKQGTSAAHLRLWDWLSAKGCKISMQRAVELRIIPQPSVHVADTVRLFFTDRDVVLGDGSCQWREAYSASLQVRGTSAEVHWAGQTVQLQATGKGDHVVFMVGDQVVARTVSTPSCYSVHVEAPLDVMAMAAVRGITASGVDR